MIYPKALEIGDKIRIVSPAGKVNADTVKQAAKVLTDLGYRVEISPYALGEYHKFSGTDTQRLHDLQNAMNDTDLSAILCSRGGYGSMRIIDKLDWSGMRNYPKFLIGFSDITALHSAACLNGVASVHGIMCKDIANTDTEAFQNLISLLQGSPKSLTEKTHQLNKQGQAVGELIGGNLSILYALQGTAYDIDWENKILFIEDLSENLYHLDRMMQSFRLSRKLEKLAGLVVGQFTEMNDYGFGKSAYNIIAETVSRFGYPVAFNFPIGHIDNNQSVLHGANYQLSIDNQTATLKFIANN